MVVHSARKSVSGANPGGVIGVIAPLKPTKVTLFTIILYNSENSTLDIRPFCRALLCHSSVVKHTSSLAVAKPLCDLTAI